MNEELAAMEARVARLENLLDTQRGRMLTMGFVLRHALAALPPQLHQSVAAEAGAFLEHGHGLLLGSEHVSDAFLEGISWQAKRLGIPL